jgi:hypothetical protein
MPHRHAIHCALYGGSMRFGRLTVIGEFSDLDNSGRRRKRCKCICDCGAERTVLKENLTSGRQVSCGCLSREKAAGTGERLKTHGMHGTRVYRIWSQMKRRCQTPSNGAYGRYGAIGVTVCDSWQKFEQFYRDMGDDNGLTLDRIDPEKGYFPENCRWADWSTQAKNKRKK